ncbi:MAG: amidohydrolase family protein, partial [Acetobacteraceae bacterium]
DRRGNLAIGMQADVAILSRDIFTLDGDEILSVQVDATLRDGTPIFDRHGAFT